MLYLTIFFIVLIIAFLCVLLFTKARLLVEFLRNGYDDHFIISLHILGELIDYKYEIPLLDLEKDGLRIQKFKEKRDIKEKEEKKELKVNFLSMFEKVIAVINARNDNNDMICEIKEYLRGRLAIENLRLKIAVGTGDAYYTGLISGLVWSAVGILASYLLNNVKSFEKDIRVISDFNNKALKIDLNCIFSIRVVHIIVVRLKVMRFKKKKNAKSKETIGGGISG